MIPPLGINGFTINVVCHVEYNNMDLRGGVMAAAKGKVKTSRLVMHIFFASEVDYKVKMVS